MQDNDNFLIALNVLFNLLFCFNYVCNVHFFFTQGYIIILFYSILSSRRNVFCTLYFKLDGKFAQSYLSRRNNFYDSSCYHFDHRNKQIPQQRRDFDIILIILKILICRFISLSKLLFVNCRLD